MLLLNHDKFALIWGEEGFHSSELANLFSHSAAYAYERDSCAKRREHRMTKLLIFKKAKSVQPETALSSAALTHCICALADPAG